MAIRAFDLLFEPPRQKPIHDSARAHIVLNSFSKEGDHILLSPECRTEREIEHAVCTLKKNLDHVLAEARRQFGKVR